MKSCIFVRVPGRKNKFLTNLYCRFSKHTFFRHFKRTGSGNSEIPKQLRKFLKGAQKKLIILTFKNPYISMKNDLFRA
jgi:energy-coupling factor transporter ATP-binding protein EcfA2